MRPPRALLRWLLAWLACLAAPALADEVLKLDQAWFTLSASASPPPGGGVAVRLPDAWMEQRPVTARAAPANGWYRMTFAAPRDVGQMAVYLPWLGLNAEVFVNGVAIGAGGAFHEPVGRNWNRPLLFVIPAPLLRAQNRLDVRLLSHPYTQANLDPVYIGSEPVLRDRYERALFWRVSLNQAATLSIVAMGALMLTLWWLRR